MQQRKARKTQPHCAHSLITQYHAYRNTPEAPELLMLRTKFWFPMVSNIEGFHCTCMWYTTLGVLGTCSLRICSEIVSEAKRSSQDYLLVIEVSNQLFYLDQLFYYFLNSSRGMEAEDREFRWCTKIGSCQWANAPQTRQCCQHVEWTNRKSNVTLGRSY